MKILFKLAITRKAVLAQNAPKIIYRPGSARTRWGKLNSAHQTP